MRTLNIEVPDTLLHHWAEWFAPASQPFLVDAGLLATLDVEPSTSALPAELRDTYAIYGIARDRFCVWFDAAAFMGLPRPLRAALVRAQLHSDRALVPSVKAWSDTVGGAAREQADGHRFVWWRDLLSGHEELVLGRFVQEGRMRSRHEEVSGRTWTNASRVVPQARSLAGTFAAASGPNCFGTVMAAAGVPQAHLVWMLREPFEDWLASSTRLGGRDADPGTVLVWRSPEGVVQHAAITIGDGWALHKPSQGWMSPSKILTVDEVKRSARDVGRHLVRYALR